MAVKNYIVILLLLAAVLQNAQAQSRRADRPQVLRQAQAVVKDTASLMQYIVDENGDTVSGGATTAWSTTSPRPTPTPCWPRRN